MSSHIIPISDPSRGWQSWVSDPAGSSYQVWNLYDYLLSTDSRGAEVFLQESSGSDYVHNGVIGIPNCPAHQAALDALSTAWGVSSPTWPAETDVFSAGEEVELVISTRALGTGDPNAAVELQFSSGFITWENEQFASTDPDNPASFSVTHLLTRYDHVLAGNLLTSHVKGTVNDGYDGFNHLWVQVQPVNALGAPADFLGIPGYILLVDEAYVRPLGAPVSGAHRSNRVNFERGGR